MWLIGLLVRPLNHVYGSGALRSRKESRPMSGPACRNHAGARVALAFVRVRGLLGQLLPLFHHPTFRLNYVALVFDQLALLNGTPL